MTVTNKHILILGKTELERRHLINRIISEANLETFRFPVKMKSATEYFNSCDNFGLYLDLKDTISHIDWISENKSLIILEEFQFMDKSWQTEIINYYIEAQENKKKRQKTAKIIISQENENGLLERLEGKIHLKKNEKRSAKQIIHQNIQVIRL